MYRQATEERVVKKMIKRSIYGFDRYLIDEFGNVYSLNYKRLGCVRQLKPRIDKNGYFSVVLSDGHNVFYKKIHRLVAQTFILNPENKTEVNHKDGNKQNNCVSNLEWVSHKENIVHSYTTGLHKKYKGKDNKASKTIFQIKNNQVVNIFCSVTEASDVTGISLPSICRCCKGKYKHAGGYQWKYKDC